MGKIIYLKVAKVASQNADMTSNIERNTITLEEGKNFDNFVALIHTQGYLLKEPPVVEEVAMLKDGKIVGKDLDKKPYQTQVDKALEAMKMPEKTVDYKAEAEKQKEVNIDLLKRIEALEKGDGDLLGDRTALEAKARELNINFPTNIKDETLLNKILEIEPDFKI